MSEREYGLTTAEANFEQLEKFWIEIADLKKTERSLYAVVEPKNLNNECLVLWGELKEIVKKGDKNTINSEIGMLSKKTYEVGTKSEVMDIKEFCSWMRNVMTAATYHKDFITEDEYSENLEITRKRIKV